MYASACMQCLFQYVDKVINGKENISINWFQKWGKLQWAFSFINCKQVFFSCTHQKEKVNVQNQGNKDKQICNPDEITRCIPVFQENFHDQTIMRAIRIN